MLAVKKKPTHILDRVSFADVYSVPQVDSRGQCVGKKQNYHSGVSF